MGLWDLLREPDKPSAVMQGLCQCHRQSRLRGQRRHWVYGPPTQWGSGEGTADFPALKTKENSSNISLEDDFHT